VPRLARLLGFAILAFVLWRVDRHALWDRLRAASPGLLVAAVLLNVPQLGAKAARWRMLANRSGASLGFVESQRLYWAALAIGFGTPGRLGEFWKVKFLADRGLAFGRALASVVLDRLFDLCLLFGLGVVAVLWLGVGSRVGWAGWIALVLAGLSPVVLLAPGLVSRVAETARAPFLKMSGAALATGAAEYSGGLADIGRRSILPAVLWTTAGSAMFFLQCWLIASSLSLALPLPALVLATALANLVSFLPITIAGIGTREAALIGGLASSGVVAADAVSYSLLMLLVFFVCGAAIGALAWASLPARSRFTGSAGSAN